MAHWHAKYGSASVRRPVRCLVRYRQGAILDPPPRTLVSRNLSDSSLGKSKICFFLSTRHEGCIDGVFCYRS